MAYTKYSLTPANNTAAPPDGAPEGMLPSAVNDTMRDMMAQIRDCGDGIRGGTYTMTAPVITGGSINGTTIGATTASTGKFSTLTNAALTSGRVTYAGASGVLQDDADFTFNGTTVTMANDASISGLTVGKGGGAVASNTSLGYLALNASNSGTGENVGVGYEALKANTTGNRNTAVGLFSAGSNTTGNNNIAIGNSSFQTNTTGGNNVAVGNQALQANTTASNNTAVGYQASYSSSTGTENSAFGRSALYTNTASNNAAFGEFTMYSNSTGTNNAAFGNATMYYNTTGSANTALGRQALLNNTTASNNTAVGYQALYSNTTASNNTALGYLAGYSKTTGNNNLFAGLQAGYSVTTGVLNSFVGCSDAGYYVTTGSRNTILGAYTGNQGSLDIRTASNYIVLSDGDGNPRLTINDSGSIYNGFGTWSAGNTTGFASKTLVDGNQCFTAWNAATSGTRFYMYFGTGSGFTATGSITTTGTNTLYNSISDARLKENIKPMTSALEKVSQLKPVTYTWKSDGSSGQGFIAHELQQVIPEAVTGEKDAVNDDGSIDPQMVDTSLLVATLTAAIQELKAEVDSLKQQLGK